MVAITMWEWMSEAILAQIRDPFLRNPTAGWRSTDQMLKHQGAHPHAESFFLLGEFDSAMCDLCHLHASTEWHEFELSDFCK